MNNILTKEKPVIFNAHDVRAILDNNKTMFRKVITAFNSGRKVDCMKCKDSDYIYDAEANFICCAKCGLPIEYKVASLNYSRSIFPLAKVNDILYVREPWEEYICEYCMTGMPALGGGCTCNYIYKGDFYDFYEDMRWKSPVTMPKAAARLFLKVTGVRLERLQDITDNDCIKEGVENTKEHAWTCYMWRDGLMEAMNIKNVVTPLQLAFLDRWGKSNTKKGYDWQSNPYVFAYEFERLEI